MASGPTSRRADRSLSRRSPSPPSRATASRSTAEAKEAKLVPASLGSGGPSWHHQPASSATTPPSPAKPKRAKQGPPPGGRGTARRRASQARSCSMYLLRSSTDNLCQVWLRLCPWIFSIKMNSQPSGDVEASAENARTCGTRGTSCSETQRITATSFSVTRRRRQEWVFCTRRINSCGCCDSAALTATANTALLLKGLPPGSGDSRI
mmetsp:Transcript_36455/g.96023  ORF Transcript_36455/g.96023 Transcript_36455/m.96023 type:complete len:208 (+) Transcript_36455:611-1234(+)